MILRKKRISTKSNDVQISISFSQVDVKAWLKYYAWLYARDTESGRRIAQSAAQNEADTRYYLEHEPLKMFEKKWREQLSAWAWNVAIRCGFLQQSATPGKENEFFFSDSLFTRPGRPPKQ